MADDLKFGVTLNIVDRSTCPTCNTTGSMHVHPDHRVYRPCGHQFPLPPLPSNGPMSRRTRRS